MICEDPTLGWTLYQFFWLPPDVTCYSYRSVRQEYCEDKTIYFYTLNFFSSLLSSTALVATVIELALMASAPTSGASRIPKG